MIIILDCLCDFTMLRCSSGENVAKEYAIFNIPILYHCCF